MTPLVFDVSDAAAIEMAAKQVETALAGRGLDGLVNVAGVGVSGPLEFMRLTGRCRGVEVLRLSSPFV